MMKKHKILSVILAGVMVTMSSVQAFADEDIKTGTPEQTVAKATTASAGVNKVLINDSEIAFDTEPEIVADRTFVPMRAIFEALGADVSWDNDRKEAIVTNGFEEINLKIGSKIGLNGTQIAELEAAPYIKDDRTMVPLRFLSESLGYTVGWDNATRTVKITESKESTTPIPNTESDGTDTSTDKVGTSVLGNDTELTYEKASARYLKTNPSMEQALINQDTADYNMRQYYLLEGTSVDDIERQTRKALTTNTQWAEKQITVTGVQSVFTIKSKMDKISLKLAEIENLKNTLKYAGEKMTTAQIKFNSGAISYNDLKSAQNEITTAQNNLNAAEIELQGLYIDLYGDLDYSQTDYAEPEFVLDYEEIGEQDVESHYSSVVSYDPYIWLLDQNVENAQFNVVTYVFNAQQTSYKLTKTALTQAKMSKRVTLQNLKTELYSRYNNILTLENSIASLENSLDQLRDSIDTLRVCYEAGVVSREQLEKGLYNESTIKYNLLNLKVQHEQLVEIYNTPYLSPTYMYSTQS